MFIKYFYLKRGMNSLFIISRSEGSEGDDEGEDPGPGLSIFRHDAKVCRYVYITHYALICSLNQRTKKTTKKKRWLSLLLFSL